MEKYINKIWFLKFQNTKKYINKFCMEKYIINSECVYKRLVKSHWKLGDWQYLWVRAYYWLVNHTYINYYSLHIPTAFVININIISIYFTKSPHNKNTMATSSKNYK
jgi:hypothetical protein